MAMPICFECNLPVLGLRGQDTMLDTYYLSSSDQDIIDANAFGDCHLICLATSRWIDRWILAVRRNFEDVRRFSLLSSVPAWIYKVETTAELFVVYPTGRIELLEPRTIQTIEAGASKIDIIEELMIEFDPVMRKKVISLGQGGRLSWLLDELGVRDRLLEPTMVDSGTFLIVGSDARGSRFGSGIVSILGTMWLHRFASSIIHDAKLIELGMCVCKPKRSKARNRQAPTRATSPCMQSMPSPLSRLKKTVF